MGKTLGESDGRLDWADFQKLRHQIEEVWQSHMHNSRQLSLCAIWRTGAVCIDSIFDHQKEDSWIRSAGCGHGFTKTLQVARRRKLQSWISGEKLRHP